MNNADEEDSVFVDAEVGGMVESNRPAYNPKIEVDGKSSCSDTEKRRKIEQKKHDDLDMEFARLHELLITIDPKFRAAVEERLKSDKGSDKGQGTFSVLELVHSAANNLVLMQQQNEELKTVIRRMGGVLGVGTRGGIQQQAAASLPYRSAIPFLLTSLREAPASIQVCPLLLCFILYLVLSCSHCFISVCIAARNRAKIDVGWYGS